MMELDLKTIISRLIKESGISEQELAQKINKKVDELSGLVSKKGAAHIIATELGIKITPTLTKQFIELSKLMPGLSNITVIGRVTNVFEIKDFEKNGKKGKVGSLQLTDGSSNARLVFWNDQTRILSSSKFGVNDILRVHHVRSKQGLYGVELHFTNRSRIEVNPEGVVIASRSIKTPSQLNVCDLQEGIDSSIRGCVVQLIKRNPLFEVCPECGKRLDKNNQCSTHSFSKPGHSMVVNAVIDDGTATVNTVFFGKNAELLMSASIPKVLSEVNEHGVEEFIKSKEKELLGEVLLISGKVVHNNFSDRTELLSRNFQKANPVIEVKKLIK